jgi:hypothetical protein
MSEQLIELQGLQALLHEINEELARAAQPIRQLPELSDEQRQQVAAELRAGLARWDLVTQQISQALGTNDATVSRKAAAKGGLAG